LGVTLTLRMLALAAQVLHGGQTWFAHSSQGGQSPPP
jgi:hypothetical protein